MQGSRGQHAARTAKSLSNCLKMGVTLVTPIMQVPVCSPTTQPLDVCCVSTAQSHTFLPRRTFDPLCFSRPPTTKLGVDFTATQTGAVPESPWPLRPRVPALRASEGVMPTAEGPSRRTPSQEGGALLTLERGPQGVGDKAEPPGPGWESGDSRESGKVRAPATAATLPAKGDLGLLCCAVQHSARTCLRDDSSGLLSRVRRRPPRRSGD